MMFHDRSSYSWDLHAFIPITFVFMSMSYSIPIEYHFHMLLGLVSHKNESLVILINPCMSFWAMGGFMDLGFGVVLFETIQMDKVGDFIH